MSIAEKLTTIAQNQQKVYDAGYAKGQAEGGGGNYDEGYEAGQKAEHDRFWDDVQQNGNRKDYGYAFAGEGWTDKTFKPKYDIKPTMANNMFARFGMMASSVSITKLLEDAGVVLDTSNCTNCSQMFYGCRAVETPHISLVKATSAGNLYYDAMFMEKAEITFAENTLANYNSMYGNCKALKDLTVHGVMDKSISFAHSPLLTNASVQSVIDCLKDLTGATAQTITFHATVGGKLTEAQKATITAKNWQLVY